MLVPKADESRLCRVVWFLSFPLLRGPIMDGQNLNYILAREPPLHQCRTCCILFLHTAHFWDLLTDLCHVCSYNETNTRMLPRPNSHPNHQAQQSRICSDCARSVPNNAHAWNAESGRCQPCAATHAENQAHRRAFATLRISVPAVKVCALCRFQCRLSSFEAEDGGTYQRCIACRKRERRTEEGEVGSRQEGIFIGPHLRWAFSRQNN